MQAFPRFCVTLRDKKQTDNISRSGSYNSSKVLSEVCRPCLSHGARPCWSTERASLRVKLRGSLELAGRLRAPAPPPPPCDHKPPREGGPASMGIDFASLSGPRSCTLLVTQEGACPRTISSDFFAQFWGTPPGMGALASPFTLAPPPSPPRREGTARVGTSTCRKHFVAKVAFLRRDIRSRRETERSAFRSARAANL